VKRLDRLAHQFVEFIPEHLEHGQLYVCVPYATAAHLCCCGCASKVVTPITPTDWRLTYDGETVTLHPSIGNWGFACESHYWIENNQVVWAGRLSRTEIEAGRRADRRSKADFFKNRDERGADAGLAASRNGGSHSALWRLLKRFVS
jgi:hypothetical protein